MVVEGAGHTGMIRSERLLFDRQGALIERLALAQVHESEVVEGSSIGCAVDFVACLNRSLELLRLDQRGIIISRCSELLVALINRIDVTILRVLVRARG